MLFLDMSKPQTMEEKKKKVLKNRVTLSPENLCSPMRVAKLSMHITQTLKMKHNVNLQQKQNHN